MTTVNAAGLRALTVAAVLTSALTTFAATPVQVVDTERARVRVVEVVRGLEYPWGLAFLPDGTFLVTERTGALRHVDPQGAMSDPIEGVPTVFAHRQGGLLDVALHPRFAENRWIYLSFAAGDRQNAGTEVARARLGEDDTLRDVEILFRAQPKTPGGLHYGSRLVFAPDGTLLITLGERYVAMQEAQDPHTHLGTVVRLRDDGSVPADNPFADGVDGAPEVYTYGHRNVQGAAVNPWTDEIWIHEHGPMGGDEINVLRPGANYGWPLATFGRDYSGEPVSTETWVPGTERPLLHWTPSIAPSGMDFYTSDRIPGWTGDLFVGSLKFMHLRRLELDDEGRVVHQEEILRDNRERIRAVRQAPDGSLYLLTDEPDGRVIRLEPAS